jgi:hypothetical protein
VILGRNTTGAYGGQVIGSTLLETTDAASRNEGSRASSPHLASLESMPQIPGLSTGAEAFGLTDLSVLEPDFDAARQAAPPDALAALLVMNEGPTGLAQTWDGYDMLLLLNLAGAALADVAFGAGAPGFTALLREGAYANDPVLGGGGDMLSSLFDADGVYATLVPEGQTQFNVAAGFAFASAPTAVGGGSAPYLVPEPSVLLGIVSPRNPGRVPAPAEKRGQSRQRCA